MAKLANQVAVITGSTSGIGRACAIRFAQEGARVVISGRRQAQGAALAKSIGDRALFIACDVMRETDIKSLISTAVDHFGHIDCLINNAGAGSATAAIAETRPEAFDADFALHVRAAFLAAKYAAPTMIERGRGSIINMSSLSAHRAGFNVFGYEVAKAALAHFTRCAAIELGEKGVRVNSISPGPTLTEIFVKRGGTDHGDADARIDEVEAAFTGLLPAIQAMPGMVRAEDIASAALFLASDDARFVNGQDLIVDGGIAAGRPSATMKAGWQAIQTALKNSANRALTT